MKRTIFLIIICTFLLLPTGTPDDLLTFWIISKLGMQLYIVVLMGLLLLMWHYKINLTKIKNTMKEVIKKWLK